MSDENKNEGREKSPQIKREELGTYFSSLREKKTYTQESLSQKTKVPLSAIIKLESGDLDFYKERLYARGFLSLLCRELGISDKSILQEAEPFFKDSMGDKSSFLEKEALSDVKNLKTKTLFNVRSLLFLGLLGLGGAGFWALKSSNNEPLKTPPNLTLEENLEETSSQEPCRTKIPEKFKDQDKVQCLTLKVRKNTVISSQFDQGKSLKKPYSQGLHHFYYTESIDFLFEDGSKVELIVKGKNWGPITPDKEEKSLSFSVGKSEKKAFPSS